VQIGIPKPRITTKENYSFLCHRELCAYHGRAISDFFVKNVSTGLSRIPSAWVHPFAMMMKLNSRYRFAPTSDSLRGHRLVKALSPKIVA
jgi:hypothetical protein